MNRAASPMPVALSQLSDAVMRDVRALTERAQAQIATSRQRDGTLTTELELAPAELGRLRLVLHTSERGLHLTVHVERPESLDAVRRQLDGFHRSLLAEGMSLDGLDIGSGGADRRSGGGSRPGAIAGEAPDSVPAGAPTKSVPTARNLSGPGRLDIRL